MLLHLVFLSKPFILFIVFPSDAPSIGRLMSSLPHLGSAIFQVSKLSRLHILTLTSFTNLSGVFSFFSAR